MEPPSTEHPVRESRTLPRGLVIGLIVALLAAAGSIVIPRLLLRNSDEDSLYIPRKEVITSEIRLLQQYVRIDTSNPPGKEMAGAQFLYAVLQRNGVQAELIETAPGRGNVYARIKGKRPGEGLLLFHHIDVVPAKPAKWTLPPFSAEVRHNMLYGRGVLDMKGIGICHLLAFLKVAKSGNTPERDLVFLASADEESGGRLGVGLLIRNRPDIFSGVRYALNEGGVTEVAREKIQYFGVETGSRQYIIFQLKARQRETLDAALKKLALLAPRNRPDRILPEVREFFRAISSNRQKYRQELADIDRSVSDGLFATLPEPYRLLTQNTVRIGRVVREGPDFVAKAAIEFLPDEDPAIVWRRIKDQFQEGGVESEIVSSSGSRAPLSSTNTPFFRMIDGASRREYGAEAGPWILGTGVTDCRYVRAIGIQCYGMWPFPVDVFQSQGIHAVDERIRLDWFLRGVKFTQGLVGEYLR